MVVGAEPVSCKLAGHRGSCQDSELSLGGGKPQPPSPPAPLSSCSPTRGRITQTGLFALVARWEQGTERGG